LVLQATYEKLQAEVPKYKMITPSVLSDRLRVSSHMLCAWLATQHLNSWLFGEVQPARTADPNSSIYWRIETRLHSEFWRVGGGSGNPGRCVWLEEMACVCYGRRKH
jgi:hypothetical protein